MPLKEGWEAVHQKLCKYPKLSNKDIAFLMGLLDINLTKNYFCFGGDFYLQLEGILMGCPMAPTYAYIFMAAIEDQYILNSVYSPCIRMWVRHINYIFVLWSWLEEQLKQFSTFLNNIHSLIKFPATKHREK